MKKKVFSSNKKSDSLVTKNLGLDLKVLQPSLNVIEKLSAIVSLKFLVTKSIWTV